MNSAVRITTSQFRPRHSAAENQINGRGHVFVHGDLIAIDDFDDGVKRRRRLPFEDRFLRPTPSGLFVG